MEKKFIIISTCVLVFVLSSGILMGRAWNKTPVLKNGEETVVEMDGFNITANDLYHQMKDLYARDILIKMIDRSILNQKYETTSDLDYEIRSQIDFVKQQTGENFLLAIKNQWGLNSEEELYDFVELNVKRSLAVEDYAKQNITDKEIKAYYDSQTVGDIRARHILIKPSVTEDMTNEEQTEKEKEALAIAEDLIEQLNKGADFSELAITYSDDQGSAINGGDLGWFNKGRMVPTFEKAAYELEVGEYSPTPVKSDFGYHIILKEDEKEKPSLEEAKDNIINILAEKKINDDIMINYTALESLRKEYNLTIHDSSINKQYKEYMEQLKDQAKSSF